MVAIPFVSGKALAAGFPGAMLAPTPPAASALPLTKAKRPIVHVRHSLTYGPVGVHIAPEKPAPSVLPLTGASPHGTGGARARSGSRGISGMCVRSPLEWKIGHLIREGYPLR